MGISFPTCKGKGNLVTFAFLVDLLEIQYILLANLFTHFAIIKLQKNHNPKEIKYHVYGSYEYAMSIYLDLI
jgi:hypothetical protein